MLTALLWAGSAMVFAAVTGRMGSVQVNISRLVLAEVYLLALLAVRQLPLGLSGFQVIMLVLSGIVGLALGDSFLFRAYQEVGARISMLLMALAPAIGAALAAIFLREHLGFLNLAGMGVTLAGVAIVVVERNPAGRTQLSVSARGMILGVLAATGQAVGLIFAKSAFREGPVDGFYATAVRIAGGLSLLLPAAAVSGRLGRPWKDVRRQPGTAGLLLLGAVLGPFLGISCSLIAVANTSVGVASTLMATVPVLMLPLTHFIYKESIPWKAAAGAIVAVAGVALLFVQ